MHCSVKWQGDPHVEGKKSGMAFVIKTGSGHAINVDTSPELGGDNLGARPMELMLAGAGGCTAIDVVMILKKGRQAITGCELSLQAERADSDPKVFTKIHFHYRLTGSKLNAGVVERAIALSKEKYCSASIMLGKTAAITHDFEIIEA